MANKKSNNKKKKKKKPKNKPWYKRINVKRFDPTKFALGVFSGLCLLTVSVVNDVQTDCNEAEQQIVQHQQENPGAVVQYIGVGGVICSIADGGTTWIP